MLAIRLRRAGSKKRPFFRVVVADSPAARDSPFVEILGPHNPRPTSCGRGPPRPEKRKARPSRSKSATRLSRAEGQGRRLMEWDAMAVVGRIARTHGLKGQVIVNLETDFPEERFKPGATMFTTRGALTITTARFQNGRPVIGIEGVETINDAEELAGLELRVPVEEL